MRLAGVKEEKNSRCQSEELARLPETEGYTRLKKRPKSMFFDNVFVIRAILMEPVE